MGMRRYRVYFNRANEAPQVWSVDEGDQGSEINVAEVRLVNCTAETKCDLGMQVNPDHPKAWIEVFGTLRIEEGVAVISAWRS